MEAFRARVLILEAMIEKYHHYFHSDQTVRRRRRPRCPRVLPTVRRPHRGLPRKPAEVAGN